MGIRSMTGFATTSFEVGGVRYDCTVRSVNRRGFDVSVRLPPEVQALEPDVRRLAQEVCGRGDVSLVLDRDASATRVQVNEAAARELYEALRRVAASVGASPEIPISVIASFPSVLRTRPPSPLDEALAPLVLQGVLEALRALDRARSREGEALERDIRAHLAQIREAWDRIRNAVPSLQAELRERTRARVQDILSSARLDSDDTGLVAALATLTDRMEVSEEVVRMEAHLAAFTLALEGPSPHGRRLDFLCQEMMREAGTLGAKVPSATLAHLVVSVKTAIERIREQLANVV